MAFPQDELPASSQLSSVLSDPPPLDNEELGEITVDLSTATISPPNRISSKDSSKMPPKKPATSTDVGVQPRRGLRQRRSVYHIGSSEDELRGDTPVSPCASRTTISAKRNRVDRIDSKPTYKPTPKPAAKKTKQTLMRGAKRWEPEFVTQNEKSPLVTGSVDLRVSLRIPPVSTHR